MLGIFALLRGKNVGFFFKIFKTHLNKSIQNNKICFDVSSQFGSKMNKAHDINDVNITVINCDLDIFRAKENVIDYKVFADKKDVSGEIEFFTSSIDAKINLQMEVKKDNINAKLTLYLPDYVRIYISSNNGDINVSNICIKNLKIFSSNGDIHFSLKSKYKLQLDCLNGDIIGEKAFNDTESNKEIICKSLNGDIIFG